MSHLRQRRCGEGRSHRGRRWFGTGGVVVLVITSLTAAPVARADPPSNDDRANAELLVTFPASVHGTTVEATVERLDPQVSPCGRIEGTVWYRIDAAPDGRVVVSVRPDSTLAPVVRVYRRTTSAIQERACVATPAGGTAVTSFETVRGAGYLILVGRRPGASDGGFDLGAELFLPPPNDVRADAEPLGRLPRTVRGTTLGATRDESDGGGCGLAGGTVWYRVAAPASGRVIVRLTAAADDFGAAVNVFERVRSRVRSVDCAQTDDDGRALVAFGTRPGSTYLIAVGERRGSGPGAFTLHVLAAEPLERLVGRALPIRGVRSTVDGVSDVNDVWSVTLRPGTTYRLAFGSPGCSRVELRAPGVRRRSVASLLRLRCDAYATFTPGPRGGGRHTIEVTASSARRQRYRLRVAVAGRDDTGVGLPLRERAFVSGALSPGDVDVLDVYHFDVERPSEVRLDLARPGGSSFELVVADDLGRVVAPRSTKVRRPLARGRYVAVVRAPVGSSGGRYRLRLALRTITSTSITVSGSRRAEVVPGAPVTVTVSVSPTPAGGLVQVRIDRFDPFAGWHFHRVVVARSAGSAVLWKPPALGRWRVRAFFAGSSTSSPSRSGYAYVLVAKPIGAVSRGR